MRLSTSFTKTFRDIDSSETAKNAQLLIRAGFIHKEMAGVYDFLPLGLRVLNNITEIIRRHMNTLGAEELSMTALQNPESWKKTGRWSDDAMDIWFKADLNAGGEVSFAPTHEEPLTNLMTKFIHSYKDLPVYAYQFQTKFRNELRAKSGILRTREFLMKDLYSFTTDEQSHQDFYKKVEQAYKDIFTELGLGDCTYQTFASGGAFSKYSHEFQTFLPVGEDTVYYNKDKSIVLNEEVLLPEVLEDLGVKREELESTTAAEVGNIFTLKYKFSTPLHLDYAKKSGGIETVFMGSYGIGVSRVMGVIVEKFADKKGLVWPENIAPYKYYLIPIGEKGTKAAEKLYKKDPDLYLYDDRDKKPGEKFADADLMGIPNRLVISDKTLEKNSAELTLRASGETSLIPLEKL
ncbi:MAG: His/Gly/Thr/Pro-type tRNA ligase C-terminal domain-containing protein [Candidatus Saccharibacteria bacterium]|nr:His/Gly/Thr/Pro-type tRNA ligase C-terminal domain-containing protein [Candidatus Saccharibacteria bacterium]